MCEMYVSNGMQKGKQIIASPQATPTFLNASLKKWEWPGDEAKQIICETYSIREFSIKSQCNNYLNSV